MFKYKMSAVVTFYLFLVFIFSLQMSNENMFTDTYSFSDYKSYNTTLMMHLFSIIINSYKIKIFCIFNIRLRRRCPPL